jgi:SPP1 gp7 family putative phage head morphogenesis protein
VTDPVPPPGQPVPPLPVDGRWPAWLVDTAIAAAGAAALSAAFAAAVGAPLALAAAFWAWAGALRAPSVPLPDGGTAVATDEPKPDVRRWLDREFDATQRITDAITQPVADVAAEGWLAGSESARAQLDALEDGMGDVDLSDPALTLRVDWGGWEPGNPEAARQVLSADGRDVLLQDLLDSDEVQLSPIAAHRVDDIAAVLSEALERGASVQETAEALRGVIDNATWAHTTAWTEMNRATSAAALAEYAADGITASEWMTAFDQRVCPICAANEQAGPVPLGEPYPSGQRRPPGHPRCRCGLLPSFDDDVISGDWDKAAQGRGYWTAGPGRAKWIDSPRPFTSLYRHLRKHMSDGKARRTACRWRRTTTSTPKG